MINQILPDVTFRTRVRDDSISGPNPYRWQNVTTRDLFSGQRCILFSLPGAFTPTCDTFQLPGFESNWDQFRSLGIGQIYCVSVNDAFVMNAWAKSQDLQHVKMIPDGNGEFTRRMGMMVQKMNLGFGMRSWRYAAVVSNCHVEAWFQEPGIEENCETDPYGETTPENILSYLKSRK